MRSSAPATGPGPFAAGARDIAPILLGVVPFGLVAGIAAVGIGLREVDAIGFSLVLYAGAAQLAAIELLGRSTPLLVVIATVLVINVRFAMYSASLAPHLAGTDARRRALASWLLTDQAYAVAIARYVHDELDVRSRLSYYLGAATTMWATWQVSTLVGALAGQAVPDAVPLGFAVPLAFLSLLVPNVTDRPTLVAGVVAAAVAVVAAPLPANLGMPVAAVAGVAAGWIASRRSRAWTA